MVGLMVDMLVGMTVEMWVDTTVEVLVALKVYSKDWMMVDWKADLMVVTWEPLKAGY